jgi:hypothetical protein
MIVDEREVRVLMLSRPDAFKPLALAQKKAPETGAAPLHIACTKAVCFA